MADGELILKLDESLARKIETGAAALGVSPAEYAQQLLAQQLFNYDDYVWDQDPRTVPVEDVDEPTFPMAEVMAEFRAELERRLAKRT